MKTANDLKAGIFSAPAMLLRKSDYKQPEQEEEEKAALENPAFGKGGPGSGRHKGDQVTVTGSADGKFTGEAKATIIDPHSNKDEVAYTKNGREYDKNGRTHLPTATVEIDRSKRGLQPLRFEAHHHQIKNG